MTVVWRDEWGVVYTSVDECGISFCDGFAHFSDGYRDYKVPVDWLEEIK